MIEGFKCEFCTEFHKDKEVTELHELSCYLNPKSRNCYTCKHNYYSDRCNCDYCLIPEISDTEFEEFKELGNCPHYKQSTKNES